MLFRSQLSLAHYQYSHTLNQRKKPPRSLKRVTISTGDSCSVGDARRAVLAGTATGQGANLTRELVNLPGNICTPKYLAGEARRLARKTKNLSVSVLDERKMADLGMHSLLSVGNGSDQQSQLIVMKYQGTAAKVRPYCLVGKGITFDTGGISLKPGAKMDEMKFDMGGAGSVFGALYAASLMSLPINIVGVIAAAENMPSGRATKPGDVVTSMSGKTIEILNTDAEGRLVLADLATYSLKNYQPKAIIDLATLTGAILVALGQEMAGLFTNNNNLAEQLIKSGEKTGELLWRMPIGDKYMEMIKSKVADIKNVGGRYAGAITAAEFIHAFVEDTPWAHIDIAGTSITSPKTDVNNSWASGFGVRLLCQYIDDLSKK